MGAYSAKGAVLSTCDESLVVGVDVSIGDVSGTSTPVIGVVLPDDGAETQGMGDGTNTVVDVTKGRLRECEEGNKGQEEETYTPAGGGDADDEFNYFHLSRVSKAFVGRRGHAYSYKDMNEEGDQMDKAYYNRIRQRPLRL